MNISADIAFSRMATVSPEMTSVLCNLEIPKHSGSTPIAKMASYLLTAIPRVIRDRKVTGSREFQDYIRDSSAKIISRLGNEEYLRKHPTVLKELARFLKAEFQVMKDLNYSKTAIKAATRQSVFFVANLYEQGKELCNNDLILKPIQKTIVHLVLHGTYSNIEQVVERYRDVHKEAKTKLVDIPEAVNLIRTIAIIVVRNSPFKSVDEAIQRYRDVYSEVRGEFSEDESLSSVLRSVAMMIFEGKKYKTAKIAKKAFLEILPEAIKIFELTPETSDLARSAAFLVLRGKYATVKVAKFEYERILKEVNTLCGNKPEYQGIVRTIAFSIFNGHYKNADQAKAKLDSTYKEAKLLLLDTDHKDEILNVVVCNVFLGRQPTVATSILHYFESEAKALELIKRAKISFGVGVSLFHTRNVTVDCMADKFQSLLVTAEKLTEDSRIKLTANTLAVSVIRKTYPTVEKAVEAYLEYQQHVLEVVENALCFLNLHKN